MTIMASSSLLIVVLALGAVKSDIVKDLIDRNTNGMMSIDYDVNSNTERVNPELTTTVETNDENINDSISTKIDPLAIPLALDISYLLGNESGQGIVQVNCRSPTSTKVIHYTVNNQPTGFMEKSVCDFQVRELLLAAIIVGVVLLFLICLVLCCLLSKKETDVMPIAIASRVN